MKGFNLVSSKQVIGEMYKDYNISQDDWVSSAQRHIARALGIMQIKSTYVRGYQLNTVVNNSVPLPCDNKMVLGVILPEERFQKLTITNSNSLGKNFTDIPLHPIYKGAFDHNYLITNFTDKKVIFVYYTYPFDKDNNLMVPDVDLVLEALPYFIIHKMSLSGYAHPVVSRKEAYDMWQNLYPQARNQANRMTPNEADRFVKMWNNPLFVDILNEDWGDVYNGADLDTLSTTEFIEELTRINNTIN